jgi:hypothetical protein
VTAYFDLGKKTYMYIYVLSLHIIFFIFYASFGEEKGKATNWATFCVALDELDLLGHT